MRFALYIKTLGEQPVPLQHNSYRDYAVALQRQYEQLRIQLGSEMANQARRSARREIKRLTLSSAAQGLVAPVPPTPPKPRPTRTRAHTRTITQSNSVSAGGSWLTPTSTPLFTMPTNSLKYEEKQTCASIPVSSVMEFISGMEKKGRHKPPSKFLHVFLHVETENRMFLRSHWDFHEKLRTQTTKEPRPGIGKSINTPNFRSLSS
jgi:hypothetical protein